MVTPIIHPEIWNSEVNSICSPTVAVCVCVCECMQTFVCVCVCVNSYVRSECLKSETKSADCCSS